MNVVHLCELQQNRPTPQVLHAGYSACRGYWNVVEPADGAPLVLPLVQRRHFCSSLSFLLLLVLLALQVLQKQGQAGPPPTIMSILFPECLSGPSCSSIERALLPKHPSFGHKLLPVECCKSKWEKDLLFVRSFVPLNFNGWARGPFFYSIDWRDARFS